MRSFTRNLPIAATLAAICVFARAELPTARLIAVEPPGGQAGAVQRITLQGSDLDGVNRLHFADPRISAKVLPTTRPTDVPQFDLSIAPNVPPGLYDLRATGRFGVTNPRAFYVTREPTSCAPSGHTDSADAMSLIMGEIAFSKFEPKLSRYFRLELKKGDRVWIETFAEPLDSKAQPQFSLLDPNRRELISSLDGRTIEIVAPIAGVYVLELHDLLYRGGAEYAFAVRISDHASSPPVEHGLWPIPSASTQPSLRSPLVIAGQFNPPHYRRQFRFEASGNTNYWLEVFSDRLNHRTAPLLRIQRIDKSADGTEQPVDMQQGGPVSGLASPEFTAASRDPVSQLNVQKAGTYQVVIRDLFHESPSNFLLSIAPPSPDFTLVAMPASPMPDPKDSLDVPVWTTLLRRGATVPVRIVALRRQGFNGEIRVHAIDLPPGISASTAVIPAGVANKKIMLTASPDAAPYVGPIKFVGIAENGTREIVHESLSGTVGFSSYDPNTKVADVHSRLTDQFMIAVTTDKAPVRMTPATRPVVDAVEGSQVKIPFDIEKDVDLTAPPMACLAGDPILAEHEHAIDQKASRTEIVLDLNRFHLPPGRHTLHAEGQATLKYDDKSGKPKVLTASFYSPAFVLNVVPPQAKK